MRSKIIISILFLKLSLSVMAQNVTGQAAASDTTFGDVKATTGTTNETLTPTAPETMVDPAPSSTVIADIPQATIVNPRLDAVSKEATLFFHLDLNLLSDTKFEDLGVKDEKNITDAVIEAWKNWAKKELGEFKNLEQYSGDLDFKSVSNHHPKNVLILFKANLRRLKRVGVIEKVDIEVGAEYVVVQLSNKKILASFDYPYIHRSFESVDQKNLSSQVASLFYNLLVAKSGDIATQIKSMFFIPGDSKEYEFSISGAKNLIEINRLSVSLGKWEEKNRSLCTFSNKVSSFSLSSAKILINSSCNDFNLVEVLKTVGNLELNQGRSFHFLPDQKTFEIFDIPAENSIKKENLTP